MFTDVDCRVGPKWVSSMIENCNSEYKIGFSEVKSRKTFVSKFQSIDFRMLMISCYSSTSLNIPLAATGQNQSYTKSLFLSVNGFENIKSLLQGDDSIFLQLVNNKKNIKTSFVTNQDSYVTAKTHNFWKDFILQRMRWAGDANIMWKYNKFFFLIILSTFFANLSIILFAISGFFKSDYFILLAMFLIFKFILEFILYLFGSLKLNRSLEITSFIFWAIFQVPYIVLMGILSFFAPSMNWRDSKA